MMNTVPPRQKIAAIELPFQLNKKLKSIKKLSVQGMFLPPGFLVVCALLFIVSLVATIYFCDTMAGGMTMPGGWEMSMMWMRMPGQSWPVTALIFVGIWLLMMVAMMMPSLASMLLQYRHAVNKTAGKNLHLFTAIVAVAYHFIWTLFGIAFFAIGIAIATFEMQYSALARAVPFLSAVIILMAAALQFTKWKRYHLNCCKGTVRYNGVLQANVATAWQHGLRLGYHCCCCCFNLIVILLTIGMMDLWAMATVTIAITMERLLTAGKRCTIAIGVVAILWAVFMLAKI